MIWEAFFDQCNPFDLLRAEPRSILILCPYQNGEGASLTLEVPPFTLATPAHQTPLSKPQHSLALCKSFPDTFFPDPLSHKSFTRCLDPHHVKAPCCVQMCIPLFSPQHLTCLCYGREECATPAASSLTPPLGALAIRFQKTKKMDFYFKWTSKSQAEINSCCCLLAWKTSTNHETDSVSIYNDLIWLKPHQSELALK